MATGREWEQKLQTMDAVTVWLVVVTEAGDGEAGRSFASTLEEAEHSRVLLEDRSRIPTDAELKLGSARAAASSYGWIKLDAKGGAALHFYRADLDRWLDRSLSFDPHDSASERGRAVAFAFIAMSPAVAPALHPAPPLVSAEPVLGTSAPNAGDALPRVTALPPPAPPRFGVDAALTLSTGFGDPGAGGLGADLRGRVRLTHALWFTAGGGFRGENAPAAEATARQAWFGGGLVVEAPLPSIQPVVVGGRLELLALNQRFGHFSHDGDELDTVYEARWLPGGLVALDVAYGLSSHAFLGLSGGLEVAFGRTDVFLAGEKAVEVPMFRAVGGLVVRILF